MKDLNYIGGKGLASATHILARSGQSPQELREFSGKDAIAPCPHCGYIGITFVRMPDYCNHSVAMRCGRCDAFRGWLDQPVKKKRSKRSLSPRQQKTIQFETKQEA